MKQKTWYHEEIANANLPLSIISHEALQAGIDFKANGDAKQSVTKSRGRPGVTTIDPKKGFVISDKGAKALISKGASDATNKQGPPQVKALLAPPLAFTSASTGISSLYHASSNAGHQVSAVRDEGQQLIRTGGVIVDHQNPQEEATVSAPSSEFSGSSSDTPDDPKDANYGQRGQRKPATPRTISGSRKAGTTCKKRKSEAPEPAKKRTRHPLDGAME